MNVSAMAVALWTATICIVMLSMIAVPFRYTAAMVILLVSVAFVADMKGLQ